MGAYLSQPITEKEVFYGAGSDVGYAGASMQGWRRHMEDAHVAATDLGDGATTVSVFGVFDGHGGSEVSRFCQKYFAAQLSGIPSFPADVGASLSAAFHKMDDMLRDCSYHRELAGMRNGARPVVSAAMVAGMGDAAEGEEKKGGEGGGDPPAGGRDGGAPVARAGSRPRGGGRGAATTNPAPSEAVLWQLNVVRRLISGAQRGRGRGRGSANGNARMAAAYRVSRGEDGCGHGCEGTSHAGATAVVAVKRGAELFVANAGDSRGVLARGGAAVAMSKDHKPGLKDEKARIFKAGGFVSEIANQDRVNGNLNVSRAIGDLKYKSNKKLAPREQIITAEPEVRHFDLTGDDRFFVLACDGVWDVMTNQEVVDWVGRRLDQGAALREICVEILDNCLAGDPKMTKGIGA
eukprot:evm.model.scf_1014.5 EVM.evm.TU.scf_1014.5   scf_1014:36945-39348(+)